MDEIVHEIIHRVPGRACVTISHTEDWVNNEGRNKFSDEKIVSAIHAKNSDDRTEDSSQEERSSHRFRMKTDWMPWNWRYST